MVKIKKYKSFISVFFAVLTLSFTSCTNNEQELELVVDKNFKKHGKDYSAEEIFRAVFFLQGELVNQVPSLYNLKVNSEILRENAIYVASKDTSLSPEEIEGFDIFGPLSDSLIEEIKFLNPNIFDELKDSIESKKPENVLEKLKKSSLLIQSALYKVYEFKEGLSILEVAEERAGIIPKDYDFKQVSEIQRFNNDLQDFIDGESDLSSYHQSNNIPLGIVVLLMVVIVVFLIAAILAVIFLFGEIFIFYFNFFEIYNFGWPGSGPVDDLPGGEIVRDLILIKG